MSRRTGWLLALSGALSCSVCFNPERNRPVNCPKLPAPAPLTAIAGDGTALTFEWPDQKGDAGVWRDWRLCWGSPEGELTACRALDGGCLGGTCSFTVDGVDAGFAYNQRVWAQLTSRDRCGKQSEPVTTSATPLNGNFLDLAGLEPWSDCDAGYAVDGGGVLTYAQNPPGGANCISILAAGDDGWFDLTIDVEVRTFGDGFAGVAFRDPSGSTTGPRQAAAFTPNLSYPYSLMLSRRLAGGADAPVATAIPQLQEGVWYALRLTAVGREVSVALAPLGSPLREALRWRDLGTAANVSGRLGLGLVSVLGSAVQADLRRLRVSTAGSIPDGGPTSLSMGFSGAGALDHVRLVPPNDARARAVACPAFDAGCSGCAPNSSSQCIELNSLGLFFTASATFDVPVGLDPERPWSLSFKFAPLPGATPSDGLILRATATDFGTHPVLSGTGGTWALWGFESAPLGAIRPGEWNRFELTFDTRRGAYSVVLNGNPVLDAGSIPAVIDPHLGALMFGSDGLGHVEHGFWTDVELWQP